MGELTITSPANARLKALAGLRRRRAREESGTTLLEGYEELSLAVDAGVRPRAVYVCPELFSPSGRAGSQQIGTQDELLETLRGGGVEIVTLSPAAFAKVSYREGPDGVLAEVAVPHAQLSGILPQAPSSPLVLVAEGIEKPGNLGAMLRTGDAAGLDAVIAADAVTDWGNPNVVRASKGTVFALPVVTASTQDTVSWARQHGVRLVVTTPQTELLHTEVDLTGAVAIVVGAEKHGVSDELLEAADERVRIPMLGRANSLNVSAAAAVVLFEAVRQRGLR